jgi:hypothetical protein
MDFQVNKIRTVLSRSDSKALPRVPEARRARENGFRAYDVAAISLMERGSLGVKVHNTL